MNQPALSRAPSHAAGAVLNGRWRLARLVGEGPLGVVFTAHASTGQEVAVKLLRADLARDPAVVARLFSEAEAASRLDHPGIVRVFEAQTAEDGTPYVVSEMVAARSLASLLATRTPMPSAQAIAVFQAILRTLSFAHGRGLAHRDLKPENVFVLTAPDGSTTARLSDFFVAGAVDAAGGAGSLAGSAWLGAPMYMSPEQLTDRLLVDPRIDLYAAASIFFELLTATTSHGATTPLERAARVLSLDPRRASSRDPNLAPFDAFFARALSRQDNERFATADDMTAALSASLAAPLASNGTLASAVPSTPRPKHTTKMSEVDPAEAPVAASLVPNQVQVVAPAPLPPPGARSLWPLVTLVVGLLSVAVGVVVGYFIAHG